MAGAAVCRCSRATYGTSHVQAVSGKMKEDGKYEIPPALEALEQKYCAELGDFQMNSSTQHWNPSDSSPKIGNKAN